MEFTHIDQKGEAKMVDVSMKPVSMREARAMARVQMRQETIDLLLQKALPKGDVLTVAKVAGIMAAKKTHELIPMCHPLNINQVDIDFRVLKEDGVIEIESTVKVEAKTGVEMEALTASAIAALTIYDMCKAVDKEMVITDIMLLEKRGGRSGEFKRLVAK